MRLLIGSIGAVFAALLTLPILLLALPFFLVGAGQRFGARIFERLEGDAVTWRDVLQYEPIIGWKPKPNIRARVQDLVGNRFVLSTGEDGWRVSGSGVSGKPEAFVFGDSFAFGFGVDDEVFFGNVLPDIGIKAIGTNGYNLVQELLLMERYAEAFHGGVVIWLVYHGNDLFENLVPNEGQYRMPFVRELKNSKGWEVVATHINPTPWPMASMREYNARLAEICCDTDLSKRAFSACDFLIERAMEVCDAAGARLVVCSVPDILQLDPAQIDRLVKLAPDPTSFDAGRPDRALEEICQRHRVGFVTLKGVLDPSCYIRGEVHWNAKGHRRVADLISSTLQARVDTAS
jgi:hypothetical protein